MMMISKGISIKITIITIIILITVVIIGHKRLQWKFSVTTTTTNTACSHTIIITVTTEIISPQAHHQHLLPTIIIITTTITVYTLITTHYPFRTIYHNAHMKSKSLTFNCLSITNKHCRYLSDITHKVDSFRHSCHKPLVNRLILLFKHYIWNYPS